MTVKELSFLKKRKILPLRMLLSFSDVLTPRRESNEYADISYGLVISVGFVFWLLQFAGVAIHGGSYLRPSIISTTAFALILVIQLIASESVNRIVIKSLGVKISPPITDKALWVKMDPSLLKQLIWPLLFAIPLAIGISFSPMNLLADIPRTFGFYLGLFVVSFSTMYGMYMHLSSSTSLSRSISDLVARLYFFNPGLTPIVKELSDLFASSLLITVATSILTVTIALLAFPTSHVGILGIIAFGLVLLMSVTAFFHHQSAIARLVDHAKNNSIAVLHEQTLQLFRLKTSRIENLNQIHKLLDISEKIQNASPRVITMEVGLKYGFSIAGPMLSLVTPILSTYNVQLPLIEKVMRVLQEIFKSIAGSL